MPDISTQQTEAAALIKEQIEALENPAQTLPYWEIYRAISNDGGSADVSTLAKEATLGAINAKLPSLSSGRVPVSLPTITAELDCRLLTTNTTIATGSYFIYLKVLVGDVTINGLTFSTNENLNFEAINNVLYPAIELVIPSGKSVRLVRGY
jgi:hypothetical protein